MEFRIDTTWNGLKCNHDPINILIEGNKTNNNLEIEIVAPFFNDPQKPNYQPGEVFDLWDYEVVEAFFLSDSGKYLELEFGPYGHYLVLLLDGVRHIVKKGLNVDYSVSITDDKWIGRAIIPESYFPCKVSKVNCYAIHGHDKHRRYEALYPVPNGKYENPDFHRLEYFQPIDFKSTLPQNWERTSESSVWH